MFHCTCKTCGGDLSLRRRSTGFICNNCGSYYADINFVNTEWVANSSACIRCGANLSAKDDSRAVLQCSHCNALYVMDQSKQEVSVLADRIVPFEINDMDTLKRIFIDNCEVNILPRNFREHVKIHRTMQFYIPYYDYEVSADVHYNLQVGTDEYKRVYNSTAKAYENKKVTKWEPTNGNFRDDYYITAAGYDPEQFEAAECTFLSNKPVAGLLKKFTSYVEKNRSSYNSQTYQALLLGNVSQIPANDTYTAYSRSGEDQLYRKIKSTIEYEYHRYDHTKDIEFTFNDKIRDADKVLIPAFVIEYEYKGNVFWMILDGVDGKNHHETIPISTKNVARNIVTWFVSPLIFVAATIAMFKFTTDGSLKRLFGILVAVFISMTIHFTFRKLQGTGNGRNKESKRKNRNTVLIGISLVLIFVSIYSWALYTGYTDKYNKEKLGYQGRWYAYTLYDWDYAYDAEPVTTYEGHYYGKYQKEAPNHDSVINIYAETLQFEDYGKQYRWRENKSTGGLYIELDSERKSEFLLKDEDTLWVDIDGDWCVYKRCK